MSRINLVCVTALVFVHLVAHPAAANEHLTASQGLSTPWPAPVGHRQPRTADVSGLAPQTQDFLDRENADVDRKIQGVCRGC
jgi:hypothetical protein